MRDIQSLKPALQVENNDVQQAQQPREQAPVVDSKAESWRTKNTWFGVDKKMTGFALGLHQELVESGIDPAVMTTTKKSTLKSNKLFLIGLKRKTPATRMCRISLPSVLKQHLLLLRFHGLLRRDEYG
jgi:hypothetical protein